MTRATSRISVTVCLLLIGFVTAATQALEPPAASQYQTLLEQYEQEGGVRTFATRFLEFAEHNHDDPKADEALLWVVRKVRGKPDTTRALELFRTRHLTSEKLGEACEDVAGSRSLEAEKLLRAAMGKSPHADVRSQACYHLARLLETEAHVVEQLQADPKQAPRVVQYYGNDYGKHLTSLDLKQNVKQRERVYQTMLRSFPDVEIQGTRLGDLAERELFAIRHLSVGKLAPEIQGEDVFGKRFKLSDYRGKVVMLSFWAHW